MLYYSISTISGDEDGGGGGDGNGNGNGNGNGDGSGNGNDDADNGEDIFNIYVYFMSILVACERLTRLVSSMK